MTFKPIAHNIKILNVNYFCSLFMVTIRFRCPLGHIKIVTLILDCIKEWLSVIIKNWKRGGSEG